MAKRDNWAVPRAMLRALRLALFALDTACFIPIVMLAAIGDPEGRRAYRVARVWARLNVRLCGVTIEVDGRERLDPSVAYVFMSNHRSAFDILALVLALEAFELRWVAKRELCDIPGFGAALRATKQIFVDRSDHARAVASLDAARGRIRAGSSVVFFPEGRRSTGPLLPFKKGGFVFAIETGAPIVPIGISGPRSLVCSGGVLGRLHATIRVVVRPPVETAELDLDDRDALLERVRRSITTAMHPPRRLVPVRRRGVVRPAVRGAAVVHVLDARRAS